MFALALTPHRIRRRTRAMLLALAGFAIVMPADVTLGYGDKAKSIAPPAAERAADVGF